MTASLSDNKTFIIQCYNYDIQYTIEICISVTELVQVIGIVTACFPAVLYEHHYYREQEQVKIVSLKGVYNFDIKLSLSEEAREKLQQKITNQSLMLNQVLSFCCKPIHIWSTRDG